MQVLYFDFQEKALASYIANKSTQVYNFANEAGSGGGGLKGALRGTLKGTFIKETLRRALKGTSIKGALKRESP